MAMTASTASRLSSPRSSVNEDAVVSYIQQPIRLSPRITGSYTYLCGINLLKALQHIQNTSLDIVLGQSRRSRVGPERKRRASESNGRGHRRKARSACDVEDRAAERSGHDDRWGLDEVRRKSRFGGYPT